MRSSPHPDPNLDSPDSTYADIDGIIWDDDESEVTTARPKVMNRQLSEAVDDIVVCLLGSNEDRKVLRIALDSVGLKMAAC